MKALAKSILGGMVSGLSRLATNGPAPIRAATAYARAARDERFVVRTPHSRFTVRVGNPIERWRADTVLSKEPETVRWLDRTMDGNSVLFDVGANIGLYTLYALHLPAAATARAVCFEPEPLNLARLNCNLHDNGLAGRAVAYGLGLGDAPAFDTLDLSRFEAGSALHGARFVGTKTAAHRVGITVARLDDFIAGTENGLSPTHLKIDVDGPELAVLRGAAATLRHPALRHVLVELDAAEKAGGTALLGDAGFTVVDEGAATDGIMNLVLEKTAA